jgi:hypothetical protein
MNIGDHVRVTRDIPPILSCGEIGKVQERWTKATAGLPPSWIVDFQNGRRSHFVYEDEMEVLELRVAAYTGGQK